MTTQALVRKKNCRAYDPAAKMCRCGNEHGSVSTYGGHACRCEACRGAQREYKRQRYTANAEKARESNRQYYAANAEKAREYKRQYYAANVERERERKRQYREANPERVRERQRQYREANPERVRESKREYYAANAEKWREYSRQYREANPERCRQWSQSNPDKVNAKTQRRRARKNAAPGNLHETAMHTWWFGEMVNLYRACPVCEVQFDESERATTPSLDHIVPLVKGGHHDTSNATILCQACNSSKCDSDMDTWLAQRREALGLPPLD